MKLKFLYIILATGLVTLLAFSAFSTSPDDTISGNEKLIKFSHKFHSDITDCATCHSSVEKSTSLNDNLLPTMDDCAQCHDVQDENNCKTCHFEDVYEPLLQKKSGLIFSHNFHVDTQKVECKTCHKGVTDVDYAFKAEQPFPQMDDCWSCHGATKTASNACEACHISTAGLLPQSHKSADFIHSHKFAASEFNANCVMCHDNHSCEECHVGTTMLTEKNTADDFYPPSAPTNSVDGAKQQQVTRVHELDYRFTHGIDAKNKTSECQTCHSIDEFCSQCHQADNQDFAMSGIEPASHLKPNFKTIGVGSGGGEHAILAKRDIESCIACHDVQGADPTCITCHVDNDGIKGTNPKTHPNDFMKDTHGDWHDNAGSICFNCHVGFSPQSPSGIGFCGYCHGTKPN
jgi:Cytochrome c7 and related cytochrome c